jgi:hypothetical protein
MKKTNLKRDWGEERRVEIERPNKTMRWSQLFF